VDVLPLRRAGHALVEPSVRLGLHVFEVAAEFGEAGRVGDRAVSRYDDAGCSASICLQASIQPWIGPDHNHRVDADNSRSPVNNTPSSGTQTTVSAAGVCRSELHHLWRWCRRPRSPVRRGTPELAGRGDSGEVEGLVEVGHVVAERVTGRQVEECIQVGRGRRDGHLLRCCLGDGDLGARDELVAPGVVAVGVGVDQDIDAGVRQLLGECVEHGSGVVAGRTGCRQQGCGAVHDQARVGHAPRSAR